MSWSSSLRFSFSSEMVATAWVTPLSSCDMVTRPCTSWERRTIVMDSIGRVPACASGLRSYLLVVFFFFFVIMCLLFIRYKKPHAALAMERTKPINQKHKQKKVTALVNIHYRAGFSSAGPSATYNKESTTNNLVV